jgi:hypothetical protein
VGADWERRLALNGSERALNGCVLHLTASPVSQVIAKSLVNGS